jgi:predicted RecB family endonuclease
VNGSAPAGHPFEPDAEQVEADRARTLLELAAVHVRQALEVPDELARLRQLAAEQMFELAILRLDVRELQARVERLEQGRVAP